MGAGAGLSSLGLQNQTEVTNNEVYSYKFGGFSGKLFKHCKVLTPCLFL